MRRFTITAVTMGLMCGVACMMLPVAETQASETDAADPLAAYRAAAMEKWDRSIQELEKLDASDAPQNSVLFLGSSSIRRWDSIATDMSPIPTIKRGYGGAKFSDLAVFIDRLVEPHHFESVVIFVGNDIAGKKTDNTPEEVLRLYKYVVQRIRVHAPDASIYLLQVTPTSSRWHVWSEVEKMHALLKTYIASDDSLHFIETAPEYLTKAGTPNDALFVKDKLHLNEAGYKRWAEIIKRALK